MRLSERITKVADEISEVFPDLVAREDACQHGWVKELREAANRARCFESTMKDAFDLLGPESDGSFDAREDVVCQIANLMDFEVPEEDEDEESLCECGFPGESTLCGTMCHDCFQEHREECEVCDEDGGPF